MMNPEPPDFTDPTPENPPAPPPVASPAPEAPKPPLPRNVLHTRIIGAIIIIAIAAIAAAVILPRPKQQVAQTTQAPQQNPSVQPQPDASVPQPPPEQTPNSPNPAPQGASPNFPAPTQPKPSALQPKPNTLQPQPRPQNQAQQALMTPQQAQQAAEQIDAVERGQIVQGLKYMATYLRGKDFQDPEQWQLLSTAMATTGLGMIPGGATLGTAQIISLITSAQNGNQAADNLERYSYNLPSALPQAVKAQIARVLSTATTPDQAYQGCQAALQASGVQLSQVTHNYLTQVIEQAATTGTAMPR